MVTIKHSAIFILICLLLFSCAVLGKLKRTAAPEPIIISEVRVDKKEFNPGKGETVSISYRISKPAEVIIKFFDDELCLVRDLMPVSGGTSGTNTVIWDGRDLEGNIVPDAAYFFTIEAIDHEGRLNFYDPTTISGGELLLPEINFGREKNKLFYQLSKDARVNIKAGITSGGPLLKNILSWSPRMSGRNEEAWDGKDESGAIEAFSQKGFSLTIEAVSLPENSIITRGNREHDYFSYKHDIAQERPKKEGRPLYQNNPAFPVQPQVPVKIGYEPKFRIELPEHIKTSEVGLPVVKEKTPIKIYLNEDIKRYVTEQRYEIIFFVDFKFVTEMEQGYSPLTLIWDTRDLSNGEHIVTVNVATLNGQISSASMRVIIQN